MRDNRKRQAGRSKRRNFYRRSFANVLLQSAKTLLTRATSMKAALAQRENLLKRQRTTGRQGIQIGKRYFLTSSTKKAKRSFLDTGLRFAATDKLHLRSGFFAM